MENTKKHHAKKSHYDLPTLASLEGRSKSATGRPQRPKVIAHKLRNRFMEVLDDDLETKIMIYITDDGKVRKDYHAVQEELAANGDGFDESDSDVNIDDVIKEDKEEDDMTSDEDEEEKAVLDRLATQTADDKLAIVHTADEQDGDYHPPTEEEEEDDEDDDGEDETDEDVVEEDEDEDYEDDTEEDTEEEDDEAHRHNKRKHK